MPRNRQIFAGARLCALFLPFAAPRARAQDERVFRFGLWISF